MNNFARDRRSPTGDSAEAPAEAMERPRRRAFDLIENLQVLRRPPVRFPDAPLSSLELNAAETLMAIAHAMAPTLDEIRSIAERHAVVGTDAELLQDATVTALVAERLPYRHPSRNDCRVYFDAHAQEFRAPDLYQGGEIVICGDVTDRDWRSEAYGRAERIIAMLYYDRRVFDDLLITSAAHASDRGSRIGPVACGAWESEVAAPFFTLKAGEVFPLPVPSPAGFHVLLMERIAVGRMRSFSEAEPEVVQRVAVRSRLAAARRHLVALAASHALPPAGK